MEPDFGQTMLILMVWGALFFIAGMRMIWVAGLAGAAARRAVRRLSVRSARRRPHQALHESGLGRHLSGRHGDGSVLERRLVRPRAGRGDRQTQPAGQPYRLRVRGRGRGIRHHPVPGAGLAVCLRRDPDADARLCERGHVRALCRLGPCDPVRRAGRDQHGGQSATDPGQRHDAALHLLWRFVDHLAGLWRRHDAGADPAASAHRGGIDECGRRSRSYA